jgi:TonB-dependent SusC/RagA subfamily outer membrane receptor
MVHHVVRALRGAVPIWAATGLALAALAANPSPALAQAPTGMVVDSKSGRPLSDAVVTNTGDNTQTKTNARGEFRLQFTGTANLKVTLVGYQPQTLSATAGKAVRVELVELVVKLDELIVTGTVGEQTTRSLGNAVGKVAISDNLVVAPPDKLQDMLSVNVPGVRIIRASGAVGSGGTTRIRGSGSLSLTNQPLIYIDGVRANNDDAASQAGGAFAFSQESASRINDLNPEEIESIEVLKGPSAATIYGTEASNGVIQIITKKGKVGRPVVEVHGDVGQSWLANPEGRYAPNFYYSQKDHVVKEFDVLRFNEARGFGSPFSNGTPFSAGGSISGGTDNLRYFISADGNRDEGAVSYNYQNKYSARANLSYSSTNDKFKVDFSMGGTRLKLSGASPFQPITTSILWACNFPGCEPNYAGDSTNTGWNDPGHGYQFYRPEDYKMAQAYDNVDRIVVSLHFTHRPTSWLRHSLTIGPDLTNVRGTNLVEKAPASRGLPFFDASNGQKIDTQNKQTFLTLDYNASADWQPIKGLISTTSAGVQYYSKQYDQVLGQGAHFAIPGPSDISGGSLITAQELYQENKTFGVYVQEQFAYKNRFFATAALRGDGNSAFGANFKAVYYPKASLSWVLSEEPFMKNSLFNTLKLRGAWGKAGQAPNVFAAIRQYQPAVGSFGLGGVTPQNFGNPDLKPEVGKEFEAGFDASILKNRVGLEFTYYKKDITDAILSLPLRPSSGFPGQQFLNLGSTSNKGIEVALDLSPIQSQSVGLDLRATFATNDTKITSFGGNPPAFVGGSFIQQWNVEGYAPGSFWFKQVTGSTVQTVNVAGIPLPLGFNATCVATTQIPGSSLGIQNGQPDVPCTAANAVYYGRPTPKWNGSFSATLTLNRRLRILGLVDALGGNSVLVGDVAAVHSFFLSSQQVLTGSDPILTGIIGNQFLAGDANGVGVTGMFKGGFARLRTVSVNYELPTRIAKWVGASRGSLTLAAENLAILWREQATSFGVGWIDPEITPNRSTGVNGNDPTGNGGYTQESWPQLARIRTTIRLTF